MTKQELEQRIRQDKSAVLIVNTLARQGQELYERTRQLLQENGITVTAAYPVKNPANLLSVTKDVIAQGNPLVIVGGGDGTLSSVVDAFAFKDTVLGLLPLGTGNSFAQTLDVPFSLEGAVQTIAQGKVAEVDLGKVNDDYFANVATVGLAGNAARRIRPDIKRYFGPLAYALAGAEAFFTHRAFRCRISSAEFDRVLTTHMVMVANGRYYGRFPLTADSTVDDCHLTVFTMGANRLELIKVGLAFLVQKHTSIPEANVFTTTAFSIETDTPQDVDLDGEVTAETPVRFSIVPNALRVMVPAKSEHVD